MQQPAAITDRGPAASISGAAEEWFTPARFALVLGVLIVGAFPQVVFGLETFVVRDFGFFAYPLALYQRECFWRGELPLWDPYNSCGVPFLAQWNTMPLYPPALFYLLLPLTWSLGMFCLLHLFWAGLGMYFLARRWTQNGFAAAVAGLIFAFNGFSLNLLMWPSHIATWSWTPWVILAVEAGWREGGRKLVLAALVGAFQMLAGGPETILFTWLVLAALWLGQLVARGGPADRQPGAAVPVGRGLPVSPSRLAVGLRFPLMVLLVAGLAAVQLVPFLDLAAHSERETGFADTRWSMPGSGWANFFVPMVFGSTFKQNLFFQYGQYWTSSYYAGAGALALAAYAVWRVGHRRVWFLTVVALVGYILASGNNLALSQWLRRLVPQLSLITYPIKYVALTIFAVPLLASFAVARLREEPGPRRPIEDRRLLWLATAALALIAAVTVWGWRRPLAPEDGPMALRNGLVRAGFLILAAAVWLVGRQSRTEALRRFAPLALLLVFWADVWTHEPPQNPTVSPTAYEPGMARNFLEMKPQPELGKTRALVQPAADLKFTQLALPNPKENYLAKRVGYFADCNLLDAVPKVNGFFSLYPRECGELQWVMYLSTNAYPERLADFLGVSQTTAPGEYTKWLPRNSFLPLATAGQAPLFREDTNALFSLTNPDFDATKLVMLPPEMKQLVNVQKGTRAAVNLRSFTAREVDLDVEAAETALVVVAQSYYHQWHAFVDGHPTPLLRANYAFQAVEVPAGKHQVQLVYRDRGLHAGAIISGAALLACLAVWLLARRTNIALSPAK